MPLRERPRNGSQILRASGRTACERNRLAVDCGHELWWRHLRSLVESGLPVPFTRFVKTELCSNPEHLTPCWWRLAMPEQRKRRAFNVR